MVAKDEGTLQFWRVLNEQGVEYILAGEFAMGLHGHNLIMPLMEILLKDELLNRQKLRQAFIHLGYGDLSTIETMQFDNKLFQFNTPDRTDIVIITHLKGIEEYSYEECYKMASFAQLEDVSVPFLHMNHLLANKKAVYRPKDQIDVIELEKIKKIREQQPMSLK